MAVNVHDLERAAQFYRDTLGMTFLCQTPGMAFIDCGGVPDWCMKHTTTIFGWRASAISRATYLH